MKTKLPANIATVEQAKAFLQELFDNSEIFHPDDDPHELEWRDLPADQQPSFEEREKLGDLMYEVCQFKEFDAYEFVLNLLNLSTI